MTVVGLLGQQQACRSEHNSLVEITLFVGCADGGLPISKRAIRSRRHTEVSLRRVEDIVLVDYVRSHGSILVAHGITLALCLEDIIHKA